MSVIECGRCFADGYVEGSDLLPEDWSRRDGLNVCARCCNDVDGAYLRDNGWTLVRSALDDLPDAGVWADPLGQVRHVPLLVAVQHQQRRDGYGQLELGAAS